MPDYWKNLAQVDPAALLRQVRREQAERNLPEFIRQAWPVIEPGTTFIDNWHIDCIGEYLEAVNRGQITRLIVNMPPRHMKSLEITVCYPAWTKLLHPAIFIFQCLIIIPYLLYKCKPFFQKNITNN